MKTRIIVTLNCGGEQIAFDRYFDGMFEPSRGLAVAIDLGDNNVFESEVQSAYWHLTDGHLMVVYLRYTMYSELSEMHEEAALFEKYGWRRRG